MDNFVTSGNVPSENLQIELFLHSLPESYSAFILTVNGKDWKLEDVLGLMRAAHHKQKGSCEQHISNIG